MKRLMGAPFILIFALVTAVAHPAFAAEASVPTARVSLDPPHILVGDRVSAIVAVPLAGVAGEPTFPDWSRGWGEAEVLEAGPVTIEGEGDSRSAIQRLTITAFKTGSVALPSVEIRIGDRDSVRTPDSLILEVRSVIAADDQEKKPAPPAPPRPQPVPREAWYALAAGAAMAAFAGILAYRRRYGSDPLAAPQLAPIAELERALGLLAERPPAEAFRGLSHAFRRYLGRAFGFHALESTTSEIQKRLSERSVPREVSQRSTATLRLADQVKFARRPATGDEASQRIAEARTLASEIESFLAPPAPLAEPAPKSNPSAA